MKKQLVLIIGAGASHDLYEGFALGEGLLQDISDRVTDRTAPENYLSNQLNNHDFRTDLRQRFLDDLERYRSDVKPGSIDGFIDEVNTYPEYDDVRLQFIQIAKYAIVFHVLGYEGGFKSPKSNSSNSCWVDEIANFINEKVIGSAEYNLKIITFNYDRTLEHLLYNHSLFLNKNEEIKAYINSSILHVYGKIGNLDWQDEHENFEFGEANDDWKKIFERKNSIDLMYSERVGGNDNALTAASWVLDGNNIKVGSIGFSFDLINYRLLYLQNLDKMVSSNKFLANIHPSKTNGFNTRREMAIKIRNINHNVELTYLSCTDFLKKFLP